MFLNDYNEVSRPRSNRMIDNYTIQSSKNKYETITRNHINTGNFNNNGVLINKNGKPILLNNKLYKRKK